LGSASRAWILYLRKPDTRYRSTTAAAARALAPPRSLGREAATGHGRSSRILAWPRLRLGRPERGARSQGVACAAAGRPRAALLRGRPDPDGSSRWRCP